MKKIKIVLVEDDEILSKVIDEELSDAGFDVTRVFSGDKALKVVLDEKPNLVLLDLILPEVHGFDILAEMKRDSHTRDIPVMILTMLGSDDDIKKGLTLGAVDYIVKSQHAVGEIIDKVKNFFTEGQK